MSFSSLSPFSHTPHPNVVDLTQNALMTNPFPQGQSNPTSDADATISQTSTANRHAAQNSEGSEGDNLTDIFLKIKSEFPTLPSLSDLESHEVQYQLSSDDLGQEGRSLSTLNLPSLEFPNSVPTSSNLSVASSLPIAPNLPLAPNMPILPLHLPVPPLLPIASNLPIPASVDSHATAQPSDSFTLNAQTHQTARRKRKITHKAQDLYLPPNPMDNNLNNGPLAKKLKGKDNEGAGESENHIKIEILKNTIISKLQIGRYYLGYNEFFSWIYDIFELLKTEQNHKECADSINTIFNYFLSERWIDRFKQCLFYKDFVKENIKPLVGQVAPVLMPELRKFFMEVIQSHEDFRNIQDISSQLKNGGEEGDTVKVNGNRDKVDGDKLLVLPKRIAKDEEREDLHSENKKKIICILQTRFLQKAEFKSVISSLTDDGSSFDSAFVEFINAIFKKFLSERWKQRFISSLSLYCKQPKVNFLKERIVPLLSPETAKMLQEITEAYTPSGSEELHRALKNFKRNKTSVSLVNFFKIAIQYAKNLSMGGVKKGIANTSSSLKEFSSLFAAFNIEEIQMVNEALQKFSIEDLNMLPKYIPLIQAHINNEIATRTQ